MFFGEWVCFSGKWVCCFRKWVCFFRKMGMFFLENEYVFFFRNEFTFFFLDNSFFFFFGKWVAHYRYVFEKWRCFLYKKTGMFSLQENRNVIFQKMGIIIS